MINLEISTLTLIDAEQALLATGAAGSCALCLPAQEYALFRVYAEARAEGWPGAGPDGIGPGHRGWLLSREFTTHQRDTARWSRQLRRYVELYEAILWPRRPDHVRRVRELILASLLDSQQFFQRKRSLLNRALREALPTPALVDQLRLHSVPRKPHRAGLLLPPEVLHIVPRWPATAGGDPAPVKAETA